MIFVTLVFYSISLRIIRFFDSLESSWFLLLSGVYKIIFLQIIRFFESLESSWYLLLSEVFWLFSYELLDFLIPSKGLIFVTFKRFLRPFSYIFWFPRKFLIFVTFRGFLCAFISFTFQGWIQYPSFCSGRTMGALVKTFKNSKFRIILVISVCSLTLPLTLPYFLPYLTIYLTLPYLMSYLNIPYLTS